MAKSPSNPPSARHRILLACSGAALRHRLNAALEDCGYDVTSCSDGRKAAAHLRAVRHDLVLTAVLLPDLDGLELVRDLRQLLWPPPAIVFAEEADEMSGIYLGCAMAMGAVCVHRAPLDIAAVTESVKRVLAAGSIPPPV